MPFLAEFTTDGRLRCSILDTLRMRTRTRFRNSKSMRFRWPRRGDARYTFKYYHNDRVVHSKKAMVTLITASSRERPATYSKIAHRHHTATATHNGATTPARMKVVRHSRSIFGARSGVAQSIYLDDIGGCVQRQKNEPSSTTAKVGTASGHARGFARKCAALASRQKLRGFEPRCSLQCLRLAGLPAIFMKTQ